MSKSLSESIKPAIEQLASKHGEPGIDPSAEYRDRDPDPLVSELVYSLLLWESDRRRAAAGFESLLSELTGLNELRVCDADEVASMLPRDTPNRNERAARIVSVLNAVFEREHGLSLGSLDAMSKRDARQYLDGLEGMPPFVAARLVLIGLGGHAMPADDRIADVLVKLGCLDDATVEAADLSAQLERAVRAADAKRVYLLLEAETEASPAGKGSRTKTRAGKKPGAKRTRKTKAES